MLGAAEVEFVVVPVVVVEVAPVLPGTVVAVCGCCGTKALIVRTAWTCGNVDWTPVVPGDPAVDEHDVAGT